jgi:hypothetical protein
MALEPISIAASFMTNHYWKEWEYTAKIPKIIEISEIAAFPLPLESNFF